MTGTTADSSASQLYSKWQGTLLWLCQQYGFKAPEYKFVSDRRGGRTAWSATVEIPGRPPSKARYWYDGEHLDNAKEDAAEVALLGLQKEYLSQWPLGATPMQMPQSIRFR